MNEHAARDIALVQAIETADADEVLLTSDDRRYAGRAAAELTHWGASQQRSPATAESFLARRAGLLLDKLGTREPAVRTLRATRWQPWIGIALPIAAGLLGAIVEQVPTSALRTGTLADPYSRQLLKSSEGYDRAAAAALVSYD